MSNEEKCASLSDILMDEENREPLTLCDGAGRELTFEQVAIIPHGKKDYAILKPISELEGIADNEAIVFAIEKNDDGDTVLQVEADEAVALKVFDKYLKLHAKAAKKEGKK